MQPTISTLYLLFFASNIRFFWKQNDGSHVCEPPLRINQQMGFLLARFVAKANAIIQPALLTARMLPVVRPHGQSC